MLQITDIRLYPALVQGRILYIRQIRILNLIFSWILDISQNIRLNKGFLYQYPVHAYKNLWEPDPY